MPRVTPLARLLSVQQIEREFGLSMWTVRDMIARGDLPAIRPPNLRRIFVAREDLERALEAWKERVVS